MTDKELSQENLPEEITSREQFLKEFMEEYKINPKKLRGKTHMVCWKINIGNVGDEEGMAYIESIQSNVAEDIKKISWLDFYIATRDEPTSLTIIDLRTMKYVKV